MATKHTAGPWRLAHSGYSNTPFVIFSGTKSPSFHSRTPLQNCNWIAEVKQDESPEHDEHTANARLIACAPEMYQALIAAFEQLNFYWMGDYEARPVAKLIRGIVAKVEGDK
jgi:hypothetical protein